MPSIPPISKGLPVLEKATNFLSGQFLRWLQSVESRLNKAVVTDANGNIAYGGATIPDDVLDGYFHIFYPNGATRIVNTIGNIYDTNNAYVMNDNGVGRWQYLAAGTATYIQHIEASGQATRKLVAIDNGGKLPTGSSINWSTVHQVDLSGNVNIKTGSTYTATL